MGPRRVTPLRDGRRRRGSVAYERLFVERLLASRGPRPEEVRVSERSQLDRQYLELVFRASRHLPVLISGIAPPLQELRSRVDAEPPTPTARLRDDGAALVEACRASDDDVARFIAEEVGGDHHAARGGRGRRAAVRRPVHQTARSERGAGTGSVAPTASRRRAGAGRGRARAGSAEAVIRTWEESGLQGDVKVQAVADLLDDHRTRCHERFPLRPADGDRGDEDRRPGGERRRVVLRPRRLGPRGEPGAGQAARDARLRGRPQCAAG